MDDDVTQEILKAMRGFNLPASAYPPWAREIGEDEWKNHIYEKISISK